MKNPEHERLPVQVNMYRQGNTSIFIFCLHHQHQEAETPCLQETELQELHSCEQNDSRPKLHSQQILQFLLKESFLIYFSQALTAVSLDHETIKSKRSATGMGMVLHW